MDADFSSYEPGLDAREYRRKSVEMQMRRARTLRH
jgi:hypothetical protein